MVVYMYISVVGALPLRNHRMNAGQYIPPRACSTFLVPPSYGIYHPSSFKTQKTQLEMTWNFKFEKIAFILSLSNYWCNMKYLIPAVFCTGVKQTQGLRGSSHSVPAERLDCGPRSCQPKQAAPLELSHSRVSVFGGESYCVPCMSQRKCLPLHAMSHLSAIMHTRSIPNHKVTSFPPFPCTLAHCKPSRSWNYQATRPFWCLQSTARLWGITISVIEPYRAIAKNHFPKLLKQNTTWKQWLKKTHPPSAAKPFQCPSLRHLFPTNAVEEHGRIGVGSQTESIMIFPPRVPYVIPYHCAKPSREVCSWLLKTHVLLFQKLHKNLRWFM